MKNDPKMTQKWRKNINKKSEVGNYHTLPIQKMCEMIMRIWICNQKWKVIVYEWEKWEK